MRSRLLAGIAILTSVWLSGCSSGSHPTAHSPSATAVTAALPSDALHKLLVPRSGLPAGINVAAGGPVDDRHDYDSLGGGASPSCTDTYSMTAFVFGGTKTQPVGNTTESFGQASDPHWFGTERLLSYSDGGAAQVVRDLKALAATCATSKDDDYAYALQIQAGPSIGDESLVSVLIEQPSDGSSAREADAVIIRSGDTLLIIDGLPLAKATAIPINDVAASAYRALQAG